MDFFKLEDAELWQSFQKGNQEAFATIYKKFFKNIYEYGIRVHADETLVQDCIQDLFVKIWANKEQLSEVKSIKAYLLISLRNIIFNKNKKDKKLDEQNQNSKDVFDVTFSVEAGYIEKESASAQSKIIFDALNKLSGRQKEFLYLKYFEELSTDEIATIMEITVKATYKLSARSLEALKKILALNTANIILLFSIARIELLG